MPTLARWIPAWQRRPHRSRNPVRRRSCDLSERPADGLPGEAGNDTWAGDSWRDRTGNNVWSFTLTVDERRGLFYLPVSGPEMNYYGGDRPGDNLFSNSTVALDAQTGKLKWHFQNIRHEIWDYNLPPAPGLIDIRRDGRTIPALAQVGKSGWMFILNRENGAPIHGVDERPQPRADVPSEWYPKTQPIPRKPGPLARVSMTRDDLVTAEDTTPSMPTRAARCGTRSSSVMTDRTRPGITGRTAARRR